VNDRNDAPRPARIYAAVVLFVPNSWRRMKATWLRFEMRHPCMAHPFRMAGLAFLAGHSAVMEDVDRY